MPSNRPGRESEPDADMELSFVAKEPRPNILLVTSDQHHHKVLGIHNPVLKTPALDRLADEGALFERAYCPNPTCTPTRASILTGTYPSTHGAWSLGTKLAEDNPTVGALLSEVGYSTSLIGKAHFQPLGSTREQTSIETPERIADLDFWREFHGPYYGFDHIELARGHADEHLAGMHYGAWLEERGLSTWRDFFGKRDPSNVNEPARQHTWDLPEELHYSVWTAERSMAAIERSARAGQPFFCWASFHDPHPPYLAPEPWASMYDPGDVTLGAKVPGEMAAMPPWHQLTQQDDADFSQWQETPFPNHGFHDQRVSEDNLRKDIAVYYGMTSFLDAQLGRILGHLDTLGLRENTLVIFTADHGHFLGHHGLTAKGAFHYEDLLRVPFLVRYPGRVPAGVRSTALQSLVDLAPSMLTAAGAKVPGVMQGVNQLGVWSGSEPRARDHLMVENRHQPTAVHLRTYIDDRYKLTLYRDRSWGELFDLHDDPGEHKNLFHDVAAADLRSTLLHRFCNAEMVREPTRYQRISGA